MLKDCGHFVLVFACNVPLPVRVQQRLGKDACEPSNASRASRTSRTCNLLESPSASRKNPKTCLGSPPTPDRAPNPHVLEKRVLGSKNTHFPSPSHGLEKGVFCEKIPIFPVSLAERRGFFDRKLPFPGRGEMGVFWTPNPLFQEMGIRGPVWGRGNPKTCQKFDAPVLSSGLSMFQVLLCDGPKLV